VIGVVDDRRRGSRNPESERGDVSRGGPRRVPDADASVARDPLLGKRRLPVAGRSDEHPHLRLRLVEEREEARSLDDPALADP